MEIAEIMDDLKIKIKEARKIMGLNSRHFGFKNWHTTVVNLLRNLPSGYSAEVNDFKKLAFEDTGYHRGKKFFSQADNAKYVESLESAISILKKIIDHKKSEKPKILVEKKISKTDENKKPPVKKPSLKKDGDISTASVKKAKKPTDSKNVRNPAKTGKSSKRKKKT
jgi:hypothetical protein